MAPRFVLLWTDAVMFVLVLALLAYGWQVRRSTSLRATWSRVLADAPALCSLIVMGVFLAVTLLDCVHFRRALATAAGSGSAAVAYDTRTLSVLDVLVEPLIASREASYSMPLEYEGFTKESRTID